MSRDQLTFDDPAQRYADIHGEAQHQPFPGLDRDLTPPADHGEVSYRGTGRLAGRRALVTGADSGIGAAAAIAFAREGASVALSYLPEEQADAQRVAAAIEDGGRQVVLLPGDIRDRDFCHALVEQAVESLGGLDILVNNGGHQVYAKDVKDLDPETIARTLTTNVEAMFWITQAALPHLPAGATIINTTSVQAYKPSPILVDFAEGQPPEKLEGFGENTALGRMGQPVECAPAFGFLASPESSYVVGETLNVNGGLPTP